jgi:hypothetical protein
MAQTEATGGGGQRWRLGSNVVRIRSGHDYFAVLGTIVVSFVFVALAPDADWTGSIAVILQAVTLLAALWTSGRVRIASGKVIGLATASIAVAVALLFTQSSTLVGLAGLFSGVLLLVSVIVIAQGVLAQTEVNAQSVSGAICIYVLLGLFFAFLYGAAAALGSGHFFAQGTDGTRSVRLYFSFVTLATLGYGDYTPATQLGRLLAVVEALFGQLYLVTVVALLVARIGTVRRER